jgi:hypothetical protein
MPTVVEIGGYRFKINTRENLFEPPHVHVWVGGEDRCRIELNGGTFMEEPPPGDSRPILAAYNAHATEIRTVWEQCHQR